MIRDEDRPMALLVGKRAKQLRLLRRATQEQVAEWVSLSVQVYARLERGEMLPSLRTLARLADAFSVEPAELLRQYAVELEVRENDVPYASRKAKKHRVEAYFAQLDEGTQRLMLTLIKHLVKQRRGRS